MRRRKANAGLEHAVAELQRSVDALREELAAESLRLRNILHLVYDREPEMRERLHALRGTAAYEEAFTDPEPLVSVVIPTWDRAHLLVERALPSVWAQTYQNLEVVVVGDHAPPETAAVLREL